MPTQAFSPEVLVTSRLLELVDHRTPWHRSLWQVGTVLALREVLENAEGLRTKAIRAEALDYVCTSAYDAVARDRGVGSGAVRDRVLELLSHKSGKDGVVGQPAADALSQLIRRIECDYLANWAAAVSDDGVAESDVELVARSVVSHLLDAGFSSDHLHGWLKSGHENGTSLADLIGQAKEMFGREPVEYEVFVPFTDLPRNVIAAAGTRFLHWAELLQRLDSEGLPPLVARNGVGALTFSVTAREPKAAIGAAEIEVRRLSARVVVGLSVKTVVPVGQALAVPASRPKWRSLSSQQRGILLSSMVRHRLLLPPARAETEAALDDAFELLASVETTTSWASVATLWAAVEGLLARVGESGAIAADRLATIVAGGFVRAELTQLMDSLAPMEDKLGELLRSGLGTPDKLDALLAAIERGEGIAIETPGDAAALARLRAILDSPDEVVTRVQRYFADAFRRLFTQRNLLLHGGRFDSVALPVTMRTVPPLVAAGLDRLVHAAVQPPRTDPFGLAARADNELKLLGTADSRALTRLLE